MVLCLALLYAHYADNPQVAGALRGMGAVAAGLITATGLKLIRALQEASAGLDRCASCSASPSFAGIALLRWPLARCCSASAAWPAP